MLRGKYKATLLLRVGNGDITMSDTFNFSGNFQGAILNVKSTLNNTTQIISTLSNVPPAEKDELTNLVKQLSEALQQVPVDKAAEAEKVAKRADDLVKEANEQDVDKEIMEDKSKHLLKAAQNVGVVLPVVIPIAQQIVTQLGKLFS